MAGSVQKNPVVANEENQKTIMGNILGVYFTNPKFRGVRDQMEQHRQDMIGQAVSNLRSSGKSPSMREVQNEALKVADQFLKGFKGESGEPRPAGPLSAPRYEKPHPVPVPAQKQERKTTLPSTPIKRVKNPVPQEAPDTMPRTIARPNEVAVVYNAAIQIRSSADSLARAIQPGSSSLISDDSKTNLNKLTPVRERAQLVIEASENYNKLLRRYNELVKRLGQLDRKANWKEWNKFEDQRTDLERQLRSASEGVRSATRIFNHKEDVEVLQEVNRWLSRKSIGV
jgi:hypothetical protein